MTPDFAITILPQPIRVGVVQIVIISPWG